MQIELYVTNQSGKRLEKVKTDLMKIKNTDVVEAQGHPDDLESNIVNIHSDVKYQTVGGIGGAFTDTSAAVWNTMPNERKEEFLKAYFSAEDGIGYNFGRLSIASCDFSREDYSYVKENDMNLTSFDISHDKEAVFPMVKAAQRYNDIKLFASPWSPPSYMKTGGSRIGGHLKKDCYALWAKCFKKYIETCKENGIDIWAVTMQNEPRHHQVWESCLYTPAEEAEFLGFLGKELTGSNVKIICYDHCRERLFERAKYIYESENGKYCDGIAHHWYSGDHFGEIKAHKDIYPEKINIASEGCCVINGKGIKEELDLPFAEKYAHDIIGCFNNGLNYYCDWNLLLDENNGPWHNRENRPCSADAPVYYIKDEDKIVYRLSYYYIGHISKFIGRGARVIASSSYSSYVETVAFENKDGSIVLVMLNRNERDLPVIIRLGDSIEKINLEKHSIVTAVIKK